MRVMTYRGDMRTTVNIDEVLLRQAKRMAAQRSVTLGEFLEDAIRREMTRSERAADHVTLPVFTGGGGLLPGVEASNRGYLEAMDASAEAGEEEWK